MENRKFRTRKNGKHRLKKHFPAKILGETKPGHPALWLQRALPAEVALGSDCYSAKHTGFLNFYRALFYK